jgi:serine/threonine protein kinase/class 3 adenylate cyclase
MLVRLCGACVLFRTSLPATRVQARLIDRIRMGGHPDDPGNPVISKPINATESERQELRHVTLFFAELTGLGELTAAVGEGEAGQMASRLLTLQEIIVTRDGAGRIVPFGGDTIYAVFNNASTALNRALEVQRVLGAPRHAAESRGRLQVRIGLHTGEVLVKEGERLEIISRHVSRARRVMEAAAAGQILASEGVVDAARDWVDIPKEFVAVEYYGEFYLRGVGATALCEVADLRLRKPEAPRLPEAQGLESPLVGRLELAGYRALERLGEGAFGVVYKAEQQGSGKLVAVKVLTPALGEQASTRKRFSQELDRLRKVNAPGVVKVLDERLDHQPPFFVMELIEGKSLQEALQDAEPERIAEVFRGLCVTLDRAHYAGIVHGDLKPGNVLVKGDGTPVLLDFGMTMLQGEPQSGKVPVHTLLSTPTCVAPEQIRGGVARQESDVYSLGILLFKVLTGREPFPGDSVHEVIQAHLHSDPPMPAALRPDVPDNLQRICLKAIEKKPEDRYAGIFAMADDLARVIREETVRTRPSYYDNALFHRVQQHVGEVRGWLGQGLLNPEEHNKLLNAYEGLQRRGLPAVMEGRHHRLWPTLVYLGGWAVINGAVLWLMQHWAELSRAGKLLLGSVPALTAFALAAGLWRLERFRLTFVALIVGIVAVPLLVGVWLHEFEVAAAVSESQLPYELFHDTAGSVAFTNMQLFFTTFTALLVAGAVMQFTRTTTHSAQTMLALVAFYGACVLWWGLRPDFEAGRWATLALKHVPLLTILALIAWWLVRDPDGVYQVPPWVWAGVLLAIGIAHAIGWYGLQEWEQFAEPIRPALSGLLLAGLGALVVALGQMTRLELRHRCRGATWLLITTGLVTVLAGLWHAGQPEIWPDGWWKVALFGAAVPVAHLVLPLVSLAMALLACRFQMLSFLLVGLAGFAGSMQMLGLTYFGANAGWPRFMMVLGAVGLMVALIVELYRTRGNPLDDLISRNRM